MKTEFQKLADFAANVECHYQANDYGKKYRVSYDGIELEQTDFSMTYDIISSRIDLSPLTDMLMQRGLENQPLQNAIDYLTDEQVAQFGCERYELAAYYDYMADLYNEFNS